MAETWTVRRLRAWIHTYLVERKIDSPAVCGDLLVAHVLRCDRMRLYMDADRPASSEELAELRALVQRAGRHEPVQYLVGRWSFYGCDLEVGPSTLIPRPSTEALVTAALDRLRSSGAETSAGTGSSERREPRIADWCTGSGCIAIAVMRSLVAARKAPRQLAWKDANTEIAGDDAAIDSAVQPTRAIACFASELIPAAAELARRNVQSNGLSDIIEVREGDLDSPLMGRSLEGTFDLILSNPPYVSDEEWKAVPPNVRDYEPATALRGGHDGLSVVRRVIAAAPKWLRPGGTLLVEISSTQGLAAADIATAHGLIDVHVLPDLEGHPRVLACRSASKVGR